MPATIRPAHPTSRATLRRTPLSPTSPGGFAGVGRFTALAHRRVLGLSLAGICALSVAVSAQAQSSGPCLIQRVEGSPVVSTTGAGPRPAEVGLALAANDTLRTPSRSRVTMACPNELKVVIGPDAEITVEGLLAGDARPFALRLLDGIAGFVFKGRGGDGVQVRTPSAVAAVRSTEWAVRVQAGATAVFTREGTVVVTASGWSAPLGPGAGIDVAATGELRPVVRWGPPRIALLGELLGPDW